MNKKELFEKYDINESHSEWVPTDDWNSVEIYRHMHKGELPTAGDLSVNWVIDFLDEFAKTPASIMTAHKNWGSLYLTAKRMVYKLSDQLIT